MPVTSKKKMQIEQRRKTVMANILAGLNYREIAEGLEPPVSIGTIAKDVQVVSERLKKEQATEYAEYLVIELRRLDVAMNGIFQKVRDGNTYAIDTMIKLQDQRLKLTGHPLAVKKIEITGKDGGPISIDDVRQRRWASVAAELGAALESAQAMGEGGVVTPDTESGDDDAPSDTPV